MNAGSPLDAYDRVLARAQDLRDSFRAGALPLNHDVGISPRIMPSSDPLGIVPPPGAWLIVRSSDGNRAYARDGALALDDGVLRTRAGAEVLGYPDGDARASAPVPLRVAETDRALGRAGDARIEGDGTVAYTRAAIDPRTGVRAAERVVLGRVALARFPAGTQLVRAGGALATPPAGVLPHVGTPGDGVFPELATHSRDAGSIDLVAGVARLDEAYRAFEALGAALKSRMAVQKTTVDLVK